MYAAHFGFSESPFENNLDQRFFFLSASHREVLAALTYFLTEKKSFALVCGDVGTGKTMVINSFIQKLPETVHPVLIINPDVDYLEILLYLARHLGIDASGKAVLEVLDKVKEALLEASRQGHQYLLIIDEAHLLSERSLEHIRLLSNIETLEQKLIQILLVGQYELSYKLNRTDMRQLRQRININRFLEPMSLAETVQYLDHRLRVVGSGYSACFEADCGPVIYRISGGVPRQINQLCDHALLICHAGQQRRVTPEVLKQADAALKSDLLLTPRSRRTAKRLPFWKRLKALAFGSALLVLVLLVAILGHAGHLGRSTQNALQRLIPLGSGGDPPAVLAPRPDAAAAPAPLPEPRAPSPALPDPARPAGRDEPAMAKPQNAKPTARNVAPGPPAPSAAQAPRDDMTPEGKSSVEPSAASARPHGDEPRPAAPGNAPPTPSLRASPPAIIERDLQPAVPVDSVVRTDTYKSDAHSGEAVAPVMDRRPAPTVTTVEASDDTTSREYGTSGPHSGAQEGLPSMAGPASPPPRQILIKSGDTLMRIASQWYPDHGSQGLEAILRANPQITNRDLIYPGQVLTIPDLGRSAWAIQLREDLHYTFYGRFFSAVELQGALTRLVQNGVKHVVLSSMDAQGNTVYQIILGGYETVRELEGAQERARRNVR